MGDAATDCSTITCPSNQVCPFGWSRFVPKGECCPKCLRNCPGDVVSCTIPDCGIGGMAIVGACCPVCKCEIKGQRFSKCVSPCQRTCKEPDKVCSAGCEPGCACRSGEVIDEVNKRCVPPEECPAPGKQKYRECNLVPMCTPTSSSVLISNWTK